MQPQGFTGKLANWSARRPWRTLGLWLATLVAMVVLVAAVGGSFVEDADSRVEPESVEAENLIDERLLNGVEAPLEEFVIIQSDQYTVDAPEFEATVVGIADQIRTLEDVAEVATYYETGAERMVSSDNHGTLILVTFIGDEDEGIENSGPFLELVDEIQVSESSYDILPLGLATASDAFNHAAESTLQRGELIGVGLAIVVLIVVFGALVAAGMPILLSIVSIVITMLMSVVISGLTDINFFIVNMITMIGLAVGIDYVLFIVSRYREERERGLDKVAAITRTGDTSTKAILFSGLTVMAALLGLLIVPDNTFFSMGLGAIIVVGVSVVMTLTLLPAVLSLLGDWLNKGRLPVIGYGRRDKTNREGFWDKIAKAVMRHPVASAIGSVAILLALGSATLTLSLGAAGISSLPQDSAYYTDINRAITIFQDDFVGEDLTPATIVIDAPDVTAPEVTGAVESLIAEVEADSFFGPPQINVAESGDLLVIEVPLSADAQSNEATNAVERLRNDYIPPIFDPIGAEALVTGDTASTIDSTELVKFYLPLVIVLVLAISFVLLLLAFRSVVVPVKAIIMNLLSVFAAYGLITLVFQHGYGADLFGFIQVDRIELWIPLFLFAVLFGLSMDYHVFLLSRIKEHFDLTGDNTESVTLGLRSTASIITGAALIMVGVFGGFALGDLAMFQQMGFGLAVAVILDATLVRSVLVPSSMVLLGKRNWYFPAWLEWLPHISVEGTPEHELEDEVAVEGAVAD